MQSRRGLFRQIARIAYWSASIALTGHIVATYFYSISPAYGISMLPTIQAYGDTVLISKYYRKGRGVAVGDVVSFKHPTRVGEHAIKRVLALPGDFVLRDTPGSAEGQMIQVPVGHCYVVGDNLKWSRDSRMFGPLPMALLNGKVIATWSGWFTTPKWVQHGLQDYIPDTDDLD